MTRHHNTKRELSDPEVAAVLVGVFKGIGGKNYYRLESTGTYKVHSIRKELEELGMNHTIATRLLRDAVAEGIIASLPADATRAKKLPDKVIELPELEETADDENGQDDDEECVVPDETELRRYQLVYRPSGWYGYYDREHDCEILVSKDKQEALERIYQLQRYPDDSHCRWGEAFKQAA